MDLTSLPDIFSEASRLRLGVPCFLANESPRRGGSHRVFKLIFEDGVQWAARVCHDPSNWEYELHAIRTYQQLKRQRPELRAPEVYFTRKCPVLYSNWVSGEPLAIWNLQIPLAKRERLLDDLAEFLLQLWTTPVPLALAQEQSPRYSVWLTKSLDRGLRRTLTGTARWGRAIDYLILRSMIPLYATECDKYTGVGFAHGDLNAYNIMRDDDFHLTG